ncbi:hypothetical protein ACVIGB_000230 [Bradyrhizobium sp. USDA 4341]
MTANVIVSGSAERGKPASTTHQQLCAQEQLAGGATPGHVQLSIGIEHPNDIPVDLTHALAQAVGLMAALTRPGQGRRTSEDCHQRRLPVGQSAAVAAKEKGQDVKIVELSDWAAPNEVVNSGDVDANVFQHEPIWRIRSSNAASTSFRSTRSV